MSKFLDAKAPMTAKCTIRDFMQPLARFVDAHAEELTVSLIRILGEQGYVIQAKRELDTPGTKQQKKLATTTRGRQS